MKEEMRNGETMNRSDDHRDFETLCEDAVGWICEGHGPTLSAEQSTAVTCIAMIDWIRTQYPEVFQRAAVVALECVKEITR